MNDVYQLISRYFLLARFVVSGGLAASVSLFVLYILTDLFGIWYLASSVASFTLGFIVSFLLQKLWTFKDNNLENNERQIFFYFLVTLFNLAVNTGLLYVLVDKLQIHYIISQICAGILVASYSFFLYKRLIFRKTS